MWIVNMHNIIYVIRTMGHKIMYFLLIYKRNSRVIRKQPNFSVRVRYVHFALYLINIIINRTFFIVTMMCETYRIFNVSKNRPNKKFKLLLIRTLNGVNTI